MVITVIVSATIILSSFGTAFANDTERHSWMKKYDEASRTQSTNRRVKSNHRETQKPNLVASKEEEKENSAEAPLSNTDTQINNDSKSNLPVTTAIEDIVAKSTTGQDLSFWEKYTDELPADWNGVTTENPGTWFNHEGNFDYGNAFYMSKYFLFPKGDKVPHFEISVMKHRFTSIGARVWSSFIINVYVSSDRDKIIFSKKHYPYFEVNGVEVYKFKKDNYSETLFDKQIDEDEFDELFSMHNVVLVLHKENGELLRIPIKKNVLNQWKEVLHSDIRKMKHEYDKK